ncbi:TPA: ATP-dependent endonuclease [Pseudomonas aeruginosa]
MRLLSFSIKNYRSITKAHKITLSQSSVLVGKNNEGKSNVLHALTLGLELIKQYPIKKARQLRIQDSGRLILRRAGFEWERDFPISLQLRSRPSPCVLRLEFALDADEIEELYARIGSRVNGSLPMEVTIANSADYDLKVIKSGPGSATISRNSSKICAFIAEKLEYNYIPAVRTAGEAVKVVEDMVASELTALEKDPRYQSALEEITRLQDPILEKISNLITAPLREFVPQIENVTVTISNEARRRALTRCDIVIDDGIKTSIERKGDGVKSLAAISLLQGVGDSIESKILALEEPESHLHPGAIHRLKDILDELSSKHQVIITTHCPAFINRLNVGSNVIIDHNSARTVKQIDEVRDILGVKVSDNLHHARLVLLVEGETDTASVRSILENISATLKKAFREGLLTIKSLDGASKLPFNVHLYQGIMCDIHAFVDDDQAGRAAVTSLLESGSLRDFEINIISCKGKIESELEDLINPAFYNQLILTEFGVDLLTDNDFKKGKSKWSERISIAFKNQGKLFTPSALKRLKLSISNLVEKEGMNAISEHCRSIIENLQRALEERVSKYS